MATTTDTYRARLGTLSAAGLGGIPMCDEYTETGEAEDFEEDFEGTVEEYWRWQHEMDDYYTAESYS